MAVQEDIKLVFQLIAEDMADLLKRTIESDDVGWHNKTGKNTLKDSNLAQTIKYELDMSDNPVVHVFVNDYISYVERGRSQHHTPRVPIDALADWVRRKLHKQPTNALLFAIQQSIYQKGIRPRPIIYYWMEEMDKAWDSTYSGLIYEALTKDLDKIFK